MTLLKLTVSTLLPLAVVTLSPGAAVAQSHGGVPSFTAHALDQGHANANEEMGVTVWMELHNKAALDKKVEALYTPGSPMYHKWLSAQDLKAYAPTEEEMETVRKELTSHNLSILETEPNHLAIRARGTVSQIEEAFNTQIHQFHYRNRAYHANVAAPRLAGKASALVSTVTGLNNFGVHPYALRQADPRTGRPTAAVPLAKANGIYFASQCFYHARAVTLTTQGASLPVGVFFGNVYGADPNNTKQGTLSPCGYSAAQVQSTYGLDQAYKQKLNGAGQTIVIIDAYGSPTITEDANAFSALNKLPQLNAKNFQVIYPEGQPFLPNTGWIPEISLDVEWAHAMAPGANIKLLIAASAQDNDFQYTLLYAITHHLGSVISNSYGYPELESGPAVLEAYNEVIELGAAAGIAVNFATGDSGDNVAMLGQPSASVPSDSPYATAVGGTSVGLPKSGGGNGQTGWGNNLTYLSFAMNGVFDPPLNVGNYGGAGGGPSIYFRKPAYQKSLPGTMRQQPDVSALADPFTGTEIVVTDPNLGGQYVEVYGGTSLAAPIFSGIWAIANQKAGHWLGQAAPIIAKMNSHEITDIVPVSSPEDVAGTVFDSSGPTYYSPSALANPLQNQTEFFSALWDLANGQYLDLTFGTDTSLTITPGWDNVTGYGTPNGMAFINAAAKGAAKDDGNQKNADDRK
ncbi:S53 family peptidase [Acidipila rosea]|nr:S53 family peptidase [Acidipila rosea]